MSCISDAIKQNKPLEGVVDETHHSQGREILDGDRHTFTTRKLYLYGTGATLCVERLDEAGEVWCFNVTSVDLPAARSANGESGFRDEEETGLFRHGDP